MMHFPALLM